MKTADRSPIRLQPTQEMPADVHDRCTYDRIQG
jgi:hypothetical protein